MASSARRHVESFLKMNSPSPYCGECLALNLGVSVRAAQESCLALTSGAHFSGASGRCFGCERTRTVTWCATLPAA